MIISMIKKVKFSREHILTNRSYHVLCIVHLRYFPHYFFRFVCILLRFCCRFLFNPSENDEYIEHKKWYPALGENDRRFRQSNASLLSRVMTKRAQNAKKGEVFLWMYLNGRFFCCCCCNCYYCFFFGLRRFLWH